MSFYLFCGLQPRKRRPTDLLLSLIHLMKFCHWSCVVTKQCNFCKNKLIGYCETSLSLSMDVVKVDLLLVQKISKRHFLRDIEKSFQEVTLMGPEPHHFFSFWNISTNMVARGIQSFGRNGPWLAGWLTNSQNFFLKFAQTWDEQMLKISSRYLDSCLI